MDLNKISEEMLIHSAVIVLHELNSNSLILTKRSEQLRSHPGQISFPGGLWEHNDRTYYDTALRELDEELGISGDRVTLIRELNPEPTLAGIIIHPWFCTIESINPCTLNTHEVASLIVVPIDLVHDRNNYRDITVKMSEFEITTCEFIPKYEYIWGATARIMKQLAI